MITTGKLPVASDDDDDRANSNGGDQPGGDVLDTPASHTVGFIMGLPKSATEGADLKAWSRFASDSSGLSSALRAGAGLSKLATEDAGLKAWSRFASDSSGLSSALRAGAGLSKGFVDSPGRQAMVTMLGLSKLTAERPGLKAVSAWSKLGLDSSGLSSALGVATDFSKFASGGSALEVAMGVSSFGAERPALKAALAATQENLTGSIYGLAGVASTPGKIVDAASSLLREIEDEGSQQLASGEPRGTISKELAYKIVIFVALLELCFVLMMATPVQYKAVVDLLGPSLGILGVVGFFQQKRQR